jgi:acetyltransferase-like isoleucine patch superfamily enzyme
MLKRILLTVARLQETITRKYCAIAVFRRAELGPKVIIGPDVWWNFHLVEPENLRLGEGTVINGECYINAQGGVVFGRYCHIGKGLTIYSSNHNYRSTISVPYGTEDILKPVTIGDCVWVGANVSILPGTTIGDGAILALGAVVRGVVPSCAIVSGNPAVIVGYRDVENFRRLTELKAFA